MSAFGDWLGTITNNFQIGNRQSGFKSLLFHNGFINSLRANPTAARTWTLPDKDGTVALLNDTVIGKRIIYQPTAPVSPDNTILWRETDSFGNILYPFFWTWDGNGTRWISTPLDISGGFAGTIFVYIKLSRIHSALIKTIDFHSLYSNNIRFLVLQVGSSVAFSYDLGSLVTAANVEYSVNYQLAANTPLEYKPSESNNLSSSKETYGTVTVRYQLIR